MMATQQRTTLLKLRDNDLKTLGCSRIVAGTLTCDDPALTEGTDYAVDYELGTVRRLRELGDGYQTRLIGFAFSYDDGADDPRPLTVEDRLSALEAGLDTAFGAIYGI